MDVNGDCKYLSNVEICSSSFFVAYVMIAIDKMSKNTKQSSIFDIVILTLRFNLDLVCNVMLEVLYCV